MKIDRSHLSWFWIVLLGTVFCVLLYVANYHPAVLPFKFPLPDSFGPFPPERNTRGGTPLGLSFGIAGFVLFLFLAAIGIRKKLRLLPIGNVQLWLKAHIWVSFFTVPLVALHCGFVAGGAHTSWLLMLYAVVMFSGFFGIAMQQFLPKMMKDQLPREVIFEQIPFFRARLLDSAREIRESVRIAEKTDATVQVLGRFLDEICLPYLAARQGIRHPIGSAPTALEAFRSLRLNVSRQWHPQIEKLETWCNERRSMDLQTRFQHWLHGWLLLHVPFSFALLIFTAWHGWAAIQFMASVP